MKQRGGFSLMELIICMLVLGVMMSVTVTSARALRHHAEVRGAADRYRAKHARARAVAIRMGRTSRLQLDTVGRRMWIELERSKTLRDTIGGVDYFDPGLRFRSDRAVLCFDGRGMGKQSGSCEAPNAMVVFSLAGRADTVRTSTVGRLIR